jgi:lactate permease
MWVHSYAAVGDSLLLTAIIVAIPIAYLFWALAVRRMKGHVAGVSTLAVTLLVTIVAYEMPVSAALSAAALGMATGLFPIGWIILTAVFLYNLTVEAGQFDIIKSSISTLSTDRRIQALLIAFCFSAFMEGVSGQGAPVAVAAAMLIGLGFSPIPAAVICLVANTPPVPFGPVGVPTSMMISVTGIDAGVLTRAIGNDMALMALIVPIFTVIVLAGWKRALEVLPAALVVGISYAVTCLLVSHNLGQELPAIISSFVSMVALVAFLRFWKPAHVWRFPEDRDAAKETEVKYTAAQIVKAWSPFIVVMIVMGLWGVPALKAWALNVQKWVLVVQSWPFLDGVVYRSAPIVANAAKYPAAYKFEYLTAPGTAMLISALITMAILKIRPATGAKVFAKTFKQLAFALVTLSSVIGIGFLANYSGMSYTLGLTFATYTGMLFPVFSPVIGWLGVFLTGSVTSSAALFGKLQQVTATQTGLNPVLTTSANLFGGVMGKLISPQSIAVACAAVGLVGRETDIFRKTIKYSLILLAITMAVVLVQAYVAPGLVPVDVVRPAG